MIRDQARNAAHRLDDATCTLVGRRAAARVKRREQDLAPRLWSHPTS